MKKMLIVLAIVAGTALVGCGAARNRIDLSTNVLVTDTHISNLSYVTRVKASTLYYAEFEKDGKSIGKLEISYYYYSDIERIKKTFDALGKSEELTFDVVFNGDEVVSVNFSNMRK